MSLVEVRNLEHHYSLESSAETQALSGITLDIEAGEYLALVGMNGSGKTTLAFHLNALLVPSAGRVEINGLDTREHRNLPEIRRTVGVVFQKPEDQIVALTVEEDVAFGPENLRLSREEIRRRVSESLRRVGLGGLEKRSPHKLSAGQKQRLAIAGVLSLRPSIIVLDEPTSMLDPRGRKEALELMAELNRDGATIIHITQRMEEAAEARRVVALDRGRVVVDAPPREAFASMHPLLESLGRPRSMELASLLSARGAKDLAPALNYYELREALRTQITAAPSVGAAPPGSSELDRMHAAGDRNGARQGASIISVEGLSHSYTRQPSKESTPPSPPRSLEGVTMTVASGEFIAIVGATGSGKSTLLQHLNGLFLPQAGSVRVDGVDIASGGPLLAALRRRVGLVFQRPEEQIFERYVGDEIAFGPRLAGVTGKELTKRVRWAMELLGLPFEGFKDRLSLALSGGEQRRVGIASILALRPTILLLDEPSAGLDPLARRRLIELLLHLHAAGTTILASTHDMELAAEMGGRIVVLSEGRLVMSGTPREVFARAGELRSIGLEPPDFFDFWQKLSETGHLSAERVPSTFEELLDVLSQALGLSTEPLRSGG